MNRHKMPKNSRDRDTASSSLDKINCYSSNVHKTIKLTGFEHVRLDKESEEKNSIVS